MASINNRSRYTATTHEGAPASRITPEQQLRRIVMASLLWERQFYMDGVDHAELVKQAVAVADVRAVAKIAIEAREEHHLRHIPLLLMRELARKGGMIASELARVIQRPDELTEFLALYWADGRCPISAQVKKGLAEAFRKFDSYQLAKYNRPKEIKLRDVLFLTHPKPKDKEQQLVWDQLAEGTLPTPDTWEVALSCGEDKRTAWERLIREKKLGGLATLRNLRNMQAAEVDPLLIGDAIEQANYNRVLPFRFIAAARHAPRYEEQLERQLFRNLDSQPKIPDTTVVLVDHSASMKTALSANSDMTRFDAACGVAMIARELCREVYVYAFSTEIKEVPARRGFALRDSIENAMYFKGTDLRNAVRHIVDTQEFDRLIVITDEQTTTRYDRPLPGVGYVINVAAYQHGVGYGEWTHIDGFSESVFRFIQEVENEAFAT